MPRTTVAFQGERGAFSEIAARMMAGSSISLKPCEIFDDVFDLVERKQAKYGVIPIENSLIGSIHHNADLLLQRKLHIIAESQVRVVHCLIAPRHVTLGQVKRVFSHPAALEQCRTFFKAHPAKEPVSYYDTAGAVKMLAGSRLTDAAAIASPYAARLHKMKVLKASIEDEKSNFTRFYLLSRRPVVVHGPAKTSIVFSLKNKPGALFRALSVFALRDIDLSKIESRPVRTTAWAYNFYVDFLGSIAQPHVRHALANLAEITDFIKVLGCYPVGRRR
ncbi:MAG: prephenate dehydratase [Candidatus Zixiibacteriota bacterium]